MKKLPTTAALTLATALCLLSIQAVAHPMTEKYIPVGAYPGWERGVVRGTVDSVDRTGKSIVVRTEAGRLISTKLGDATYIWLDRSEQKKTAQDGDLSDVRRGQQVELRREGGYGQWVKVKVTP